MGYADDGHEHGKRYNAALDDKIANWFEYKRQKGLVRLAQVLLGLAALLALFQIASQL